MIVRTIQKLVEERLHKAPKVQVIYGPRQVGKTTLVKQVLENFPGKTLHINADDETGNEALQVFSSRNLERLKGRVAGYDLLFIDEAQRIPEIGVNLKILFDNLPGLKIMVTGSSTLDLSNRVKEPLTGRTWTYRLFPISVSEWQTYSGANDFELGTKLEEWLRFGMYPEVFRYENFVDKKDYLHELSTAYLYKDILAMANIKFPEKLKQLLKLLAFQVGSLVSTNELANNLQINRETVYNYIDLLEKAFVIFRLGGFSRNLRKEVVKMDKIYFYDVGIRNAIIGNFNEITSRQDTGALWENFLIAERQKKIEYQRLHGNSYFWRTYTGAKLDYVEERDGKLLGFEIKWGKRKPRPPKTWLATYHNASYQLVNRENFLDFVQ